MYTLRVVGKSKQNNEYKYSAECLVHRQHVINDSGSYYFQKGLLIVPHTPIPRLSFIW